ncbi:MAG: FkbM family methyltransferase, partial [Caldilineaceae bacterium]
MKRRLSLGRFIDLLPQNRHLYRICKRYLNRYDGNNNSDMYTNGEMWWLQRVLPECRVVFDVGANVGNWAAAALSINSTVSVHCFEPSEAAFKKLSDRSFDGASIYLNHLGLSETAGETTLFVFEPASTVNSLYQRDGIEITQTQTEKVRLDTVDAYCRREGIDRIDLLKIDTEGHELMVLNGAAEMLKKSNISRIQFEYGGAY